MILTIFMALFIIVRDSSLVIGIAILDMFIGSAMVLLINGLPYIDYSMDFRWLVLENPHADLMDKLEDYRNGRTRPRIVIA